MFFNLFKRNKKKSIKKLTERELKENQSVLESLRDYDEGKKEISTDGIKRRLPRIRTSI